MSQKTKRINRRASRRPPASGRKPSDRMSTCDVTMSAEELQVFHRQYQPLFPRREQRAWSLLYLCGQLSNLERKTIEPMVLSLIGAKPNAIRGLQQFIGQGEWDTAPLMIHVQSLVSSWLGEDDGVVIVDGSGFPKQGKHSIGVAHQYCGHLGKVANCQQGVFLGYVSRQGYTFLDERLYLPQEWFAADHRQKRQACGLPAAVKFQTETELALEMLQEVNEGGVVPFQWVAMGRPRSHRCVRRTAPPPEEVRALILDLPRTAWQRHWIHEGSQGPLLAEFAILRVTPVQDRLPGLRQWLICRRSLGPQVEVKFYLSNAPSHCSIPELVRVSGLRWPIETALEEAKGEVGMDHYETRSWLGWHHHMLQTFLAHLFLVRLRILFKKNFQLSPRHKLGSWWPRPSLRKVQLSRMRLPLLIIISNATMQPIVHIVNAILPNNALQNALAAKRRSNIQNVVVM